MEEWLVKFHFLRPWWLGLLLVPLFFYARFLRGKNNKSSWEKVCDRRLLDFLLIKGSSLQRKIMSHFALVGMVVAIIAAAGPSWEKIEIPSLEPENPVMILLNLSSDMKGTDLQPNRLFRAKYKIQDFVKMLKGAQIGLEVYSREPFVISPLTEDGEIILNLLPAINLDIMPSNGDRLDRALDLAVEKFKNAGFIQGEIVVFTPDVGQNFDLALAAAQRAKAQNYRVNVIATAVEPSEKLQLIAQRGGGDYWNLATSDQQLASLAEKISHNKGELKESKNWQSVWLDYGYYFLILPMLCCLYFFRKGILVLFLVLGAFPAQAGFFTNDNQDGLKYFNNGDYQKAGETFADSKWKGSSWYRTGNYEQAYLEFAKNNDTTSLYNQGNAFAKSGKIEEAIQKYEEVLKQDPKHEDARFNLEYLKKQQNQQQQNQQQSAQQQQKNKKDKDESSPQEKDQNKDQGSKQQPQNSESDKNSSEQEQNSASQQQQDPTNTQNQENAPQEEKSQSPQTQSYLDEEKSSAQEQKMSQKPQPKAANNNRLGQKEEQAPKYDEEVQAKAQQYREIPEDPGGLLKAFILKEYQKNRYREQQ